MRFKPFGIGIILLTSLATVALLIGTLRSAWGDSRGDADFIDQRQSVQAATFWLVREFQNDDGGYASLSSGANQSPSSIAGTLDAMLAIAAGGYNPAAIFPGQESSPVQYLREQKEELAAFAMANGGQAGKTVMALTAATLDPRDFEGHDFVTALNSHFEPSGSYGVADPFKQAIAILGVAAVGGPVPEQALTWLDDKQDSDGSWDDGFGTPANPDTTALVIMAQLAGGRLPENTAIQSAVEFLAHTQQPEGWAYGSGLSPSANSTALVIQALSALGEDWYTSAGPWSQNGRTPLQALSDFQNVSGAFQSDFGQGPFDDFYATVQAIPAMAGRPFPLPGRLESSRLGLSCLDALQDSQSGGWSPFAGSPVDAAGTSRAIQAIVAAGDDPQSSRWTVAGGDDAAEALESLTPDYLSEGRGGRVGVILQGVATAGEPYDVHNFAGEDLPLLVSSYLSPTGEYDSTAFGIFPHAEAMLGLAFSGEPVAPSAIEFLYSSQINGDWGDVDSNGIALQVLGNLSLATRPSVLSALKASQNADGGWGLGGISNPSSSSEVVQGLTAVGSNPFGPGWSKIVDGRHTNAADSVMAQQGDGGCWPNAFGPGDDPYSTTDAILLLTQQAEWGISVAHLPLVTNGQ